MQRRRNFQHKKSRIKRLQISLLSLCVPVPKRIRESSPEGPREGAGNSSGEGYELVECPVRISSWRGWELTEPYYKFFLSSSEKGPE